jgi:hypothetical protein
MLAICGGDAASDSRETRCGRLNMRMPSAVAQLVYDCKRFNFEKILGHKKFLIAVRIG